MAIVKSLVSQMGGEITVESKLNKGTNFMLVLPLRAVEENAQEKEAENQEEYSLDGKKILLAEDYEMNMEIATELLEMEGVSVVKAWNGKEALERFKESEENEFDAILMDMQMPVMDGCTAAVKIRELSRTDAKEIPIIALTANAYAENIASTMNAGMNAHIVKPIDTELLRETLGKLIAEKSGGV